MVHPTILFASLLLAQLTLCAGNMQCNDYLLKHQLKHQRSRHWVDLPSLWNLNVTLQRCGPEQRHEKDGVLNPDVNSKGQVRLWVHTHWPTTCQSQLVKKEYLKGPKCTKWTCVSYKMSDWGQKLIRKLTSNVITEVKSEDHFPMNYMTPHTHTMCIPDVQ